MTSVISISPQFLSHTQIQSWQIGHMTFFGLLAGIQMWYLKVTGIELNTTAGYLNCSEMSITFASPKLVAYYMLHTSVFLKYFIFHSVYWDYWLPWILFVRLWQRCWKCSEAYRKLFARWYIQVLFFLHCKTVWSTLSPPPYMGYTKSSLPLLAHTQSSH